MDDLRHRDEIRELTARYNESYDAGLADEFGAVFTPDAVMEVVGGPTLVGSDSLRGFAEERGGRGTLHVTTDAIITVDGDHAVQRCSLLLFSQPSSAAPELLAVGRYRDELTYTEDGWRFSRRRVNMKAPTERESGG